MVIQDDKKASRGIGRDMSAEAIARRLRIVSDLRILSLKLGRAENLKPKEQGNPQSEAPDRLVNGAD